MANGYISCTGDGAQPEFEVALSSVIAMAGRYLQFVPASWKDPIPFISNS